MLVPRMVLVNSAILQGMFFSFVQYSMSRVELIANVAMVSVAKIAHWVLLNHFVEIH